MLKGKWRVSLDEIIQKVNSYGNFSEFMIVQLIHSVLVFIHVDYKMHFQILEVQMNSDS